jgi:hypothetical protein
VLAANIVWDDQCSSGDGPASLVEAASSILELLSTTATPDPADGSARPCVDIDGSESLPSSAAWQRLVKSLLTTLGPSGGEGGQVGSTEPSDYARRRRMPTAAIEVCSITA